jgi:hypothetical protein
MVNVLQWKHAAIHNNESDLASAMSAVSTSDHTENRGAPEGWAVPAPLVAPVMLI